MATLSAVSALAGGRISIVTDTLDLTGGDVVQVVWTALPEDVQELELLLLLEDARSRIRLTEQLDPEQRAYRWRVPPLASRSARLAIRFNRGRGEEAGPESAAFTLLAPRKVEPLPVVVRAGELWATAPLVPAWSEPPLPVPQVGDPSQPLWQAAELAFFRLGQDATTDGHAASPCPSVSITAGDAPPPSRPSLSRRPRVVPLRD